MLAYSARGVKPVRIRHLDVHDNQIRTLAIRQINGLFTVFRLQNSITFLFQPELEHQAGVVEIVDNHDCAKPVGAQISRRSFHKNPRGGSAENWYTRQGSNLRPFAPEANA